MRLSASLAYLAGAIVAVGAAAAAVTLVGLPGSEQRVAVVAAQSPPVAPPIVAPCDAQGHTTAGAACSLAEGTGAADGKSADAQGDQGDVLASGTPQLLEFEAAYCSACATMAPVVKAVVSSCAKAAGSVKHVDVGDDKGEAIARRYAVAALPTFIAVDADGHEVFRRVGVQAPKEIASILAEVTGEHCVAD